MRRNERQINRDIEALEEALSDSSDAADDDPTPVAIVLGDEPLSHFPDPNGIPTYPTLEAAKEELGEDIFEDSSVRIWDFRESSDAASDDRH